MKTFFTLCTVLFLAVVTAIFFAGYVSKSNRQVREGYEASIKDEMVAMTATINQATTEIEKLKIENAALSAQLMSSTTTETKVVATSSILKPAPTSKQGATIKPVPVIKSVTPVIPKKTITVSLVGQHKTAADCWIIVSGKAYSVSNYMAMHPGGKSMITTQCGKDATSVFTSRGGTGQHSKSAWSLLDGLLVGALGSVL
jgi:cytochrome b involved in lipid metabolism